MKRSLTSSTLAVMLATLLSMVLGFAREVVNAKYFGERWELDAFLVAAILPTLVFGVFNGALVSALVPILSGYFAAGKDEEAWRFSSTVINVLIILLSLCAAAARGPRARAHRCARTAISSCQVRPGLCASEDEYIRAERSNRPLGLFDRATR